MKVKNVLLALIVFVATSIGLSVFLQDMLSRGLIDEAAETQQALVRTAALADDVRLLQIDFKWQVQAFKDILLRGKDPDLFARHKNEYDANLNKVAVAIPGISGRMQSEEYAPVADAVKRLAEDHKLVSTRYSEAIDTYAKLLGKSGAAAGLAADEPVRGIDRQLTADIDTLASFTRKLTAGNAAAAAEQAAKRHAHIALKLYLVAAVLIVLVIIAGLYVMRLVMSALGAEPLLLRDVAEKIATGDLTTTIPAHDADNESSLASHLLLMQMKMRSLVTGIRDETKGALERARRGARLEDVVEDMRALSKSMRRFKTGATEELL